MPYSKCLKMSRNACDLGFQMHFPAVTTTIACRSGVVIFKSSLATGTSCAQNMAANVSFESQLCSDDRKVNLLRLQNFKIP